jgi:5-formyltetrahydrofolate cyclo-ligase
MVFHQKRAIRTVAKDRRSQLPDDHREEKSARIARQVIRLVEGDTTVLVYASKPPEVDTAMLIQDLLAAGKKVVVPIIERETKSLRLSYLFNPTFLVKSTFNVPEPIGNEIPAPADEVDVAVIPMIAFDRHGNRLGYGAGYYDRFLQKHLHIRKIGIAFSDQQEPALPHEPGDIRMDLIVTESETLRCNHTDPFQND